MNILSQNTTYRTYNEKLGSADPNQFAGDPGDLFWDPYTGNIKLADGVTPGGRNTNTNQLAIGIVFGM
jgi:hypothetical protein